MSDSRFYAHTQNVGGVQHNAIVEGSLYTCVQKKVAMIKADAEGGSLEEGALEEGALEEGH